MFWGLIMEPQKRYSQVVKKSFHVSMASLDLCSCTEDAVQVMCGFENRKYLMCTLKKDQILQCSLDLNFEVGDEVSFVTNGTSHVHLTGYLNDDFNDQEFEDEDEIEEEEEVVDQLGNISESNITSGKRPKKASSAQLQPPAKKSKTMKLLEEVVADEDSDDSDVNMSNLADDDDDDESSQEEEQSDEEDGEEVEEEEDDDDSSDDALDAAESSDEDVTSSTWVTKALLNGVKKPKNEKIKKEEASPPPSTKKAKKESKTEEKVSPKKESSQKKTIEGGVIVEDIKQGEGPIAKPGKMVQVYYEGRFKNNNKVFDSSLKGNGFKFRLGRQEVIKGWDVGVTGMKVGGKRRIVCPPNMAYGAKGSPPAIPPNSTLVFEVELKKVN